MRRLAPAGAVLVLGAAAALTALASPTPVAAATVGPDAQAWWSSSNTGGLVGDPATPPDVGSDQLYVAGAAGDRNASSTAPAPLPAGVGDKGLASAIAALRFTVPAAATIDTLTLQFAGSPPPTVSVLACRTTVPFAAVQDGPWSSVPAYDCSVPSVGALSADGKSLVFGSIGALRSGTTLSFVIVPQNADREVLARPDSTALSMRAPLPAFAAPAGSSSFGSAPAPVATVPAAQSGSIPVPAIRPPAVIQPVASPVATAAATAGASSGAAAVAPAASRPLLPAAVPLGVDDRRARILASVFLGGLAAVALAMLLHDAAWLRRLLGLRTPLVAATADPGAERPRGVGRFARPRQGRPEAL